MGLLIALAGVITPLGIYQTLAPAANVQTPFKYLVDTSPFGFGTPRRSNLGFNRVCTDLNYDPIPCPSTKTVEVSSTDGNFTDDSYPDGYDISIPQTLLDIYSSGVGNDTTISNFFDIQWRQYMITADPTDEVNNGSNYLVGVFRGMQILSLNNAVEPVEGLIVDTINGGIGFRNREYSGKARFLYYQCLWLCPKSRPHFSPTICIERLLSLSPLDTVPPGFQFGVTWEEDILFIEPETVCVDTNTTIDYTIGFVENDTLPVTDLVLTDRGGFVNLEETFPVANMSDPQANPDLWTRAYKAAWMTNTFSMLLFNVTNPHNFTTGQSAFSYLNTSLGKTFPLIPLEQQGFYDSLAMDGTFNTHLNLEGGNFSNSVTSGFPNPFGITSDNFTDIGWSSCFLCI
jgi:hypothetical protein